jgi:hypothetical protein
LDQVEITFSPNILVDVGEFGCFSASPWIELCDEHSWRMKDSRRYLVEGAIEFMALFSATYNDLI